MVEMAKTEFQVICAGCGSPQASVLFPTYRSRYLEQALASLLAQQDVIIEILISDDASGDDTPQRIMRQLGAYQGPHRVLVRTGQQRLRLDHFALLVMAASCEIVIMGHDDDIALPQRVRRLLELFALTGADVISSNCMLIDAQGRSLGLRIRTDTTGFVPVEQLIRDVWQPPLLGATLAWRRSVYMDFPYLDTLYLNNGHDCLLAFRGALRNGFYYTDEPLLQRRHHAAQWSRWMFDQASRLTTQEATATRLLGICLAMHKDITYLKIHTNPAARHLTPHLDQLELLIIQSLIYQANEMYTLRSRLSLAGKQAVWVDAPTFTLLRWPSLLRLLWQHEPLRLLKKWLKTKPILHCFRI